MDLIKLQLKYKKELKKLEKLRYFFTNIFFIMWMWPILSGLSGAIFIVLAYAVNIINLQDWAIVLIIIIIFLLGIIMPFVIMIFNPYSRYCNKFLDELVNTGIDAETLLAFGTKYNIQNTFSRAMEVRLKELGGAKVPEWCVRDGVLPTMEDIKKAGIR